MHIIQEPLIQNSNAFLKGYVRDADVDAQHFQYPAIIIVPGGSFTHISEEQAESFALSFAAQGYQSFYLRYSFENEKRPLLPHPTVELGKAIAMLHERAVDWNLDADRIVIAGFSIGGLLVSQYNNQFATPELIEQVQPAQPEQLRPAATILGYPVIDLQMGFPKTSDKISDWASTPEQIHSADGVSYQNAPTFIWATADDPVVPATNALSYAQALAAHHVNYEIHVFHHGPHGMAMANELTANKAATRDPHVAEWFPLAIDWLKETIPPLS